MSVQTEIQTAYAKIQRGKKLISEGEILLKKLADKSCRIVEKKRGSKNPPRPKGLSEEQKYNLLKRI